MISIQMLRIYRSSSYKPLELIFKSCNENGTYPSERKKANVVPVHKKDNLLSNCFKSYLWQSF